MEPRFLRPDLLVHPNLPKPLHGISPRTCLGSTWWNNTRRAVYEVNNFCCFACGTHKSNAKPKHLEAHEAYDINWETGEVQLKEIVALCRPCHLFIHSGRLMGLVRDGIVSENYVVRIMERGLEMLQLADLTPTYDSAMNYMLALGLTPPQIEAELAARPHIQRIQVKAQWHEWKLILGDDEYRGQFKSKEEWAQHYRKD